MDEVTVTVSKPQKPLKWLSDLRLRRFCHCLNLFQVWLHLPTLNDMKCNSFFCFPINVVEPAGYERQVQSEFLKISGYHQGTPIWSSSGNPSKHNLLGLEKMLGHWLNHNIHPPLKSSPDDTHSSGPTLWKLWLSVEARRQSRWEAKDTYFCTEMKSLVFILPTPSGEMEGWILPAAKLSFM